MGNWSCLVFLLYVAISGVVGYRTTSVAFLFDANLSRSLQSFCRLATDWVSFSSFGSSKIGQTSLCPTDRLLFLYLFIPVEELQNLPLLLVDTFMVLYIYRKTDLMVFHDTGFSLLGF